jgi:ubiquinone/menaquinone biosynthesis C-methylase UbiE
MNHTHADIVPNHHADHPAFSGATGLAAGLTMVWGRGAVARLAADLAGVTTTDHVIDVGCGPGAAVREAHGRGARVTGVDPAPVMLKLARTFTRSDARIAWTEGTAEALPLPDASATVLWSISTVHHWADIEQGLQEVHRVLVPGGRLLAIERQVRRGATGHASHGWTSEQAEAFARQCEDAGFEAAHTSKHTAGREPVVVVQAVRSPTPSVPGTKRLAGAASDLDVLARLDDEHLSVAREP